MEKTVIYCGSAKQVNDGFTKITVCLSDLPKEFIFEYNGKKYIKLDLAKKQEVDKYGKTHSLKVDTWKPEPKIEDREVYRPNEKNPPMPGNFGNYPDTQYEKQAFTETQPPQDQLPF